MDLRSYLGLLRRHLAAIIATTVVGLVAGLGLAMGGATNHRADVSFYVATSFVDGRDAMAADQFAQSRVATYLDLVDTDAFAQRVIAASGIDLTVEQVGEAVEAQSEVGTVLISTTVTREDAASALAVAQAVEKVFPEFVNELENATDQEGFVTVEVVSSATEATDSHGRDPLRWGLLGAAIGLIAGVVIALVRDATDSRLRTIGDLEDASGVPVLAELDDLPTAAQQVRALLGASQMVLVTSAGVDAYRSPLAQALAQAYTEAGLRTAVVDAAVSSTALRRRDTTEDSAAGSPEIVTVPGASPDAVAHKDFAELLTRTRSSHDRVVVVGPGLTESANDLVLSALCDDTVVVVDPNTTDRAALARAAQQLAMVGGHLKGTVLIGRAEH